jgi:hypothetical protein
MTAARDLQAELEFRTSKREKLRRLLLTGRTFTTAELVQACGSRFGGRLEELRKGKGGPALDVRVARANPEGSSHLYTLAGFLISPDDIGKKEALRKRLAVVRSRQNRLREEEAALLEQLTGGGA